MPTIFFELSTSVSIVSVAYWVVADLRTLQLCEFAVMGLLRFPSKNYVVSSTYTSLHVQLAAPGEYKSNCWFLMCLKDIWKFC
jgi:hypothetical protein